MPIFLRKPCDYFNLYEWNKSCIFVTALVLTYEELSECLLSPVPKLSDWMTGDSERFCNIEKNE